MKLYLANKIANLDQYICAEDIESAIKKFQIDRLKAHQKWIEENTELLQDDRCQHLREKGPDELFSIEYVSEKLIT